LSLPKEVYRGLDERGLKAGEMTLFKDKVVVTFKEEVGRTPRGMLRWT